MVTKKVLVVALLFFLLAGAGVVFAVGNLAITPASDANNEFDFDDKVVSVKNSLTNPLDILDVRVYKNDARLGIPADSNLNLAVGQSFDIDLAANSFDLNNYLRLEAFYDNGTFLGNTSIKINPQAPTLASFGVTNDAPIEGDSIDFFINVEDPSGIDSVIATVSVNDSCDTLLKTYNYTMNKKVDEPTKYELKAAQLEYLCEYSFVINANDTYGNSGESTVQKLSVAKLLSANKTYLLSHFFDMTGDELGFDKDYSGTEVKFAEDKAIDSFNFDSGKYGIHSASFSFANQTDIKTVVSKAINVDSADYKVVSDLAYLLDLKDGFEVKITPSVSGVACFKGNVSSSKDIIMYCSGSTLTDCDAAGDWKIKYLENGCLKQVEAIGSYFVLATCKDANWVSGVCKTSLDTDSSSSAPTKKTEPKTDKINTGGTNVFGATGAATANSASNTSKSEGGLLSGFGSFFAENTGTSVSIAVGVLLAIGLSVFVIYRIKRGRMPSGTSASTAPLLQNKEGDKRVSVSIHELAKRHDVHKPSNPKDSAKLKEFIDVAMMLGHNAKDLSDALKYRGWDPDVVDKTIKLAGFKDAKDL